MMTIDTLLNDLIEQIRSIPVRLFGDDSPLADPWEEIKDQVQNELSFFWQGYLDTMNGITQGTIDSLSIDERAIVSVQLNVSPENIQQIYQKILKRLFARAKKEKIIYTPFDFTHFRYTQFDMAIYAQVLERTGIFTCHVMAFSGAAPFGERGEVNTSIIEETLSSLEFDLARQKQWPEKWA
jgi:hypothetical protein